MIRIFKTSLSSSSDSPEGLTTELGQQTSPGRRGFGPKSSGHRSPGGGASILANKRLTLPFLAFVAVLTAGLLFLMPGGLLQAQSADPIEHPENSADPVLTFTAEDPEGRTIYWSLVEAPLGNAINVDGNEVTTAAVDIQPADAADAGDFMISPEGVLKFKMPPDFEMPMSRDAFGTLVTNGTFADRNVYKVVVVASDDAPGASGVNMAYHKVIVHVTDMDEDGSISFSAQQPQASVALTATLKDQDSTDAQIGAAKWKWHHCPAVGTTCAEIPGATTNAYTPPGAVSVGRDLMAVATYKDASGSKEVEALAAHAVRAKPGGKNASPVFRDEDSSTIDIQVSRSVDENSPPGTKVGQPVTAGDAGDVLTYSISATGNAVGLFSIDPATGQIMVGPRTMLNREALTTPFQYTVTVTATDPWGITTIGEESAIEQDVTITVKAVNEAPSITSGPTKTKQEEDAVSTDATPIDPNDDVIVTTYIATDPESDETDDICSECTWSVSGPDSALFDNIMKSGTAEDIVARLTFKKAPNFEKPADANMDNIYLVTVVVTDPGMDTERAIGVGKLTAMRDVAITVTNKQEKGKIKFSSIQPKEGVEFIATLTDDDGPTNVTKWQWGRDVRGSEGTPTTGACSTFDGDWEDAEGKGAKTDTYTPEVADLGKCLRVIPTYTDLLGDSDVIDNVSANPVVKDTANKAPQFKDANGKVITSTTRSVAEDAVTDDDATPDVGSPVEATDPNATETDNTEILTYTLGGTDARYFEITDANSSTGQITVKEDTKLDHEKKKSYTVTVTATDPSRASTTIDVTINVTDVNEGPEFTAPKEGNVDVTVKENTRSLNIYSFRATDPEGRTVYWSLEDGDETSSFTISDRGDLSLKASPNYETKASYTFTVVASDDASGAGIGTDGDGGDEDPIKSSMKTVTVTVEDVEETGSITTSPMYPQMDKAVEADLTDADGDLGTITYEWKVGTKVAVTDSDSYTPDNEDVVNKMLSVKASYTQDGAGVTVTKSAGTIRKARSPEPDHAEYNAAPAFTDTAENNARSVDENKRADTTLGKAIKATDANRDSLTYSLSGTDESSFRISSSGLLSTAAMLDHEADGILEVTITATDPWGETGTIDVDVTVNDVNEAPMIDTGPSRRDREEKATDDGLQVFVYVASDPDEGDDAGLTWTIEGEDAAKFNIVEGTGALTFKESPDYEMPADRNKDNLYKVTVVVSDDGSPKLTDKRQVEVTVTDVEEPGVVSLSSVRPKVAIDLTATLKDSDGDVEDTAWQWYRSDVVSVCPAVPIPATDQTLETALTAGTDWSKVPDAESDTYTPEAGDDTDVGKCLLALAKYNDRRGTSKAAAKQSDNEVIDNTDNRAPMFPKTEMGVRKVAENTANNEATDDTDTEDIDESTQGNIVGPVTATDGTDTLTYTLGGTDAASFNIDAVGQLSTKAKLDHEDKSSYMVTVTATDPNGLSATIDVTIMVMDVDEAPKIYVGGLIVTGKGNVDYAENGMGMVATYSAAGPDAADATWSLSGADAGDLSISSAGVLTFSPSPNYESPADANTDNIYMVVVNANDGTNDAMKAVTVTVTNEDEMGRVTFWRDGQDATTAAIMVGDELGGAVDDSDGNPGDTFPITMYTRIAGVNVTSWQWARSMDMDSWTDIGTGGMYTVMDDDAGYYLRATAMYNDGEGTGKMKEATTMMVGAMAEDSLLTTHDDNKNGKIDRPEVLDAIRDFVFNQTIEREDVVDVIRLFLFG